VALGSAATATATPASVLLVLVVVNSLAESSAQAGETGEGGGRYCISTACRWSVRGGEARWSLEHSAARVRRRSRAPAWTVRGRAVGVSRVRLPHRLAFASPPPCAGQPGTLGARRSARGLEVRWAAMATRPAGEREVEAGAARLAALSEAVG
jgi:hypothetical protein